MSLIERAAQRLEELRRAGIAAPDHGAAQHPPVEPKHTKLTPASQPADSPRPDMLSAPTARGTASQVPKFEFNLEKLAAGGFVTPDMPRSRVADEFRIIKRPLLANATEKNSRTVRNANLVMVTSAVPGEGKTFSAINLAMSMAMELNRTVLLIDADVARPSLPGVLGLPVNARGLLDVLEDSELDLGEVLVRTSVDKLSILPSGTPHSRATELLASDAMTRLLDEVASRYPDRMVVFDSPPLLATTESRVLATHMGQIVFVVHAEKTLQSEVLRALATIETCPIKLVLLNQARTTAQGAYGYGYGYGT